MAPTSTIVPLAIAGFISTVQAAVPSGVVVADGTLRQGQVADQVVVVTGWETTMREPASFGLGALAGSFSIEEQFDILGYVQVLEGSEVQSVSRTAALALFADIESAVRSDPTLGTGGGINAVRVSWLSYQHGQQGPADGARGNGTLIDFRLHAEGRVQ